MRFFLRYIVPTLAVILVATGLGLAQYTNYPNTNTGTATGVIDLFAVITGSAGYTVGTTQPGTQDVNGNININCQVGCSASSDPSNGPVAPGAPGTASKLIGGIFNSSPPSLTNGQQAAAQLDSSGNLDVNVKVLPSDPTQGSVAPGSAGTKSQLTGGVFNSAPPTLTNGQQAALQFDSNGNLKIDVAAGGASGGTSSTFGAAFPSLGTAIGFSQGGNMVAATGTSGNLNVNCQVGCTASSDTANGPVTPGAPATNSKLIGGQFNTVLPTLTNAQQAAVQLDSSGRQLVAVGSALPTGANVIGQVGGTTVQQVVQPTVTVASYSAGQCVGGLMTFNSAARASGPGSGILQSAVVTDVSGSDAAMDLVFFTTNPTSSTFTDHATCTVNNADLQKIAGTLHVTDCNLLGVSAPGVCQAVQQAEPYALGASNTTLWAVLITRGTPTYAATSNIAVRLGFLED